MSWTPPLCPQLSCSPAPRSLICHRFGQPSVLAVRDLESLCSNCALGYLAWERCPIKLLSISGSTIRPEAWQAPSSQRAVLNLAQTPHRPSEAPERRGRPHFLSPKGCVCSALVGGIISLPHLKPLAPSCPLPSSLSRPRVSPLSLGTAVV